jgi:membrane dipeptidase
VNRREAIHRLASTALLPFFNFGHFQLFADPASRYSTRCIDLVRSSLVVDMLSQFKLGAFPDVVPDPNPATAHWWSHPETFTPEDLARYRESSINVFQIGWGTGQGDAYEGALKVMKAWKNFVDFHHKDFLLVSGTADLARLKPENKVGILLGFQDSDHFRTAEDVFFFYRLGQLVSQLTYNVQNQIGSGYTVHDTGLTPYGHDVVAAMNKAGMAIDLSHCGPRTTWDACSASKRPVLFTHADCKALCSHTRNKSDAFIKKMAATGGVMGISSVRMFVRDQEPVTIENVLDHFDHVARLVGVEHVGVGSDIDLNGYDALPPSLRAKMLLGHRGRSIRGDIDGLNHPQRMFDLTEGLIRRGYSDDQIRMILGGNFARVLKQIES